jgi:uracil-DNA glycosylase family protein
MVSSVTSRGFAGGQEFVPETKSLRVMREAVQDCRGCDLYRQATQAVFGEGPNSAQVVFVGEQPGNEEDLAGRPFVGPAGRIFDQALEEAGIDRAQAYVTNAVKHFKFEERGKRRIHKKPSAAEATACKPWLAAEIQILKPRIIVCLGATAAQSLLGKQFRLTHDRGKPIEHSWAPYVVATTHPSAILRIPDHASRHEEYARLVSDLKKVRSLLKP